MSARLIGVSIVAVLFVVRLVGAQLRTYFGTSFSAAVFGHLGVESFRVAATEHWVAVVVGTASIAAWIWVARRRWRISPVSGAAAGWVLAAVMTLIPGVWCIAVYGATWSHRVLDSYLLVTQARRYYAGASLLESLTWSGEERAAQRQLGLDFAPARVNASEATNANLLIVYLESFRADWTEMGGSRVAGLTPNLDAFARAHTYVPNAYNAVTPTISAFVSSQCGLLSEFGNIAAASGIVGFATGVPCLSDVLSQAGYRVGLMLPIPREFAGMDEFAFAHRYDEVVGMRELLRRNPAFARSQIWGVFDYDLVEAATNWMERQRQPFALSLFTMDTHGPFFSTPSECPVYRDGDPQLNAIHCADHAFGRLVHRLRESELMDTTNVIVVGDHMPHDAAAKYGRVFMAMRALNQIPSRIDVPNHTPDLAPTALELLGFQVETFNLGKSLFGSRQRYQHLVAPRFDIHRGRLVSSTNECADDELLTTVIEGGDRVLTQCERRKITAYQSRWLLGMVP